MPKPSPLAVPSRILPSIVLAQFSGASLWFAGNAVLPDLQRRVGLPADAVGDLTTAVQLGFIVGTFIFAYLAISDRWSPRKVFLACAWLGAISNLSPLAVGPQLEPLLAARFMTGFFLAGIYPVGMKIASGWYASDLGRALGFLVGALVLGTAAPHAMGSSLPWETVILAASAIAAAGGVLMYVLVPDGPYLRTGALFDPRAIATIFRSPDFRASSFGYFGHMWELYAFWAFLPAYLAVSFGAQAVSSTVSAWTFAIVAAGAVGCMGGGLLSLKRGSAPVAFAQLATSAACCLLSPWAVGWPLPATLAFLLIWGVTVAGDSPQFSALNARYAPPQFVGSALTIVNCIGFAITVVSIQLLQRALPLVTAQNMFLLLLPGPLLGLIALWRLVRSRDASERA